MSLWGLDFPICWDSPCCPHCSLWGELCVSLHSCPRVQPAEGEYRTCPQGWDGAGSWTRCTWPFRDWLHSCSLDNGHRVSVDVETVTGVKPDSPETLVREADDMRGMWTGWVLRWFREVGPVRSLVTINCEYIEMLNFKLGFFAPFSEYTCYSSLKVRNPHVGEGGWVSSAGLFLWPWPVLNNCLVWWVLITLYNIHSLKQEVEHPKGIFTFTGMSLWQNKLPNKFISCSIFLIFLVFIVLHLISLRQVSFQMCQVDHLPFGVFHGSPNYVDSLPSVDPNKQSVRYFSSKNGFIQHQQRIAVWGLHLWRAKCKSPKCQGWRALLQRGRGGWEGSYRVQGFSLPVSLPGKERSLSSSSWALLLL